MKLYRNLSEAVVNSLDQIFAGGRYADKVIEKTLKQNPKWGARDRRFIAETTYDIVRWYRLFRELSQANETDYWKLLGSWCLWNRVELPDWQELKGLSREDFFTRFDAARKITAIRESIPDWLDDHGRNELGADWEKEIHSLNQPAAVVLRVNTIRNSREALRRSLEADGVATTILDEFPDALLLNERQNIFGRQQFKDGLFEVQDAGSQLIAPFLETTPGMRTIDACAGAGGKSLHLAALMKGKGRIIAMDTEKWKLDELKKRARRAGVSDIVETRVVESSKSVKRLEKSADRLLLDVPCSGLGVLKRNPDAKWKLDLAFIERVKGQQQRILAEYSDMVKPGGKLVYSTCSILPGENEKQVEAFLESHTAFTLEEERHIMPSEGFDGFYMARLKRTS